MLSPVDDRFWFSFKERQDGSVAYEFMDCGQDVEVGTAPTVAEMFDRFDVLVARHRH